MSKEKDYSIRDTINKINPDHNYTGEDWSILSRIIQDIFENRDASNLSLKDFDDHDIENITKQGLYFVNEDDEKNIKKVLYLSSTNNKLRSVLEAQASSVEISEDTAELLHTMAIKQCDDKDFYFNLSRLDLKDYNISIITDPTVLPLVLHKLINNNNKVQSCSFSFYENNEISNETAQFFVEQLSSLCSVLTQDKGIKANIDFYECPKVYNIVIKDEYKPFVTVQYESNNDDTDVFQESPMEPSVIGCENSYHDPYK